MSHIILPKNWSLPEKSVTPEHVFYNRRTFLKQIGMTAVGIAGTLYATPAMAERSFWNLFGNDNGKNFRTKFKPVSGLKRNPAYTVNRPMTEETVALKYNNFYEFTSSKKDVWHKVDKFQSRPWAVEIVGNVENPGTYAIDDLIRKMPIEERVYRHRCVETWAMVVPWNGFSMSSLIKLAQPKARTRYVKFVSFMEPEIAPGQIDVRQPWPYTEGLSIDEAMNELTFLATGIYGHTLPAQHGAPIRLVTPWKYGFKSIKSITKIEFTNTRPATFWNTLIPHEYDFQANVNPNVPHPRWSQRREKMIGTGEVFATQKFNGYEEFVKDLYL